MANAKYNNARLISGEPCAIRVPVTQTGGIIIKQGDLCALVSGEAKPADQFTWTSNLATTQENFHDTFLGSAIDQKAANDTDDILCATRGRHKYPCAALSADKNVGTLFGPAQGSGNTLDPQTLVEVATAARAVGRLAEKALQGATSVIIELLGSLTPEGGVQAVL